MKIYHLILGSLFVAGVLAQQPAQQKSCVRPFACYVHEWEELRHPGISAFQGMKEFYDQNCPSNCVNPACGNDLSTSFSVDNVVTRGIQFKCDIGKLFCKVRGETNCIPIRDVVYLPKDDGSSTKNTTNIEDRLKRVETVMLPTCRHGDSEDECDILAPRYCEFKDINENYDYTHLAWLNLARMCTVVEAPLGGGESEWFANKIVGLNQDIASQLSIWSYTGLPHKLVTSTYLPDRYESLADLLHCEPYIDSPIDKRCRPLPICDEPTDEFYHPRRLFKDAQGVYHADRGGTKIKCERACYSGYDQPNATPQCRALDLKDIPVYRQGEGPFAKLMSIEETLEFAKEVVAGSEKKGPQDITNVKYPRPLNIDSIKNPETKAKVRNNAWLAGASNPFQERYGKVDVADIQVNPCDGTAADSKIFCNPSDDEDNGDGGGGLGIGLIIGIIIGVLFGIILLVLIIVGIICLLGYMKKKKEQQKTSNKNESSPQTKNSVAVAEDQQPLVGGEQGGALTGSTEPAGPTESAPNGTAPPTNV